MTLRTETKVCPYDGTTFEFTAQGSGTAFDRTLDWMTVGALQSPWPLAVCPTNGFVFAKQEYSPEELEALRPLILSPDYQALKDETPYFKAAWVAERRGEAREQVSLLLLQATWEAGWAELRARYQALQTAQPSDVAEAVDKKRDRESARVRNLFAEGTSSERYARYVSQLLPLLEVDARNAAAGKSIDINLLVGDLQRRLKQFDLAEAHFARMAGEVTPGTDQAKILAFENSLVANRDAGIHFISEVEPKRR
jgi:hypothetical protein